MKHEKISELLSNSGTCRLGLAMVAQKDSGITAQDMCYIIRDTTLALHQQIILAAYCMQVSVNAFMEFYSPHHNRAAARMHSIKQAIDDARWREYANGAFIYDSYIHGHMDVLKLIGAL